jgi:alkanesulfonate monooxygenase SsuD/methylene tetrahydromethanopterin reductase-like flavin-dependent oxidoreductase (luciferase family)
MTRADFDREADHGAIYVGSPETVARRIAITAKALSLSHFRIKYSAGHLAHDKIMRNIELYGRRVMPLVRDMLSS